MNLLFITQKLDKNDDLLGVYHEWIRDFAEKFNCIIIICLQKAIYDLPDNVRVFSLGKEKRESRIAYLKNFYRYIWKLRKDYDIVFVHMNSEYVILGGLFWKLWAKKIFLWYNHKIGGIKVLLAIFIASRVFYTSPFAFSARFEKSEMMPVGIDTNKFKANRAVPRVRRSILSLGRISPVKNIDILLEALERLDKEGVGFIAHIYGDYPERDKIYYQKIRQLAKPLEKKGKVIFHKGVPNCKTPEIYSQNEIFVNLTQSGSFDKTIIEAMACANLVLASNKSLEGILPDGFLFKDKDPQDLAEKFRFVLALSEGKAERYKEIFRRYAVEKHDIKILINKLINALKSQD
jgi:glycosyltransferase involved in cell wall biosynthesis